MEVISFYLKGKMAHFRKYYSNSTSLSYHIPPRMTIVGIIAGILGYERNEYYYLFNLDKCKISIAIRSPIKKIMQKMNLLLVESSNDLNGSNGCHSQTATEFIIPHDISKEYISYQIWFYHKDSDIMDKLRKLLGNGIYYHSKGIAVALGSAQLLGWIEFTMEDVFSGENATDVNNVKISSAIPLSKIINIDLNNSHQLSLVKEDYVNEFDDKRNITSRGKSTVIVNLNNNPVSLKVKDEYCKLNNGDNILWIE